MSSTFGIEAPGRHHQAVHRKPARYLVVIDAGGSTIARLFLDTRAPAGEFDAGTEEVALMTRGLMPALGAAGPEWDRALDGHSSTERTAAEVYTLDV